MNPGVYPPAEDSYLLLNAVKNARAKKALEIGCGCGLISMILARNSEEVFAIDVSREACANTLQNSKRNGLEGIIHVINGDMATAFRRGLGFDLVVSNPPYLPVEQSAEEDVSWAAGRDNSFSKKLLENTLPLLSDNGIMLIVQSSLSDLGGLKRLVEEKGFKMEEASHEKFFFERIIVFKISKR
ncbi:MAG: methyltransferase [Thermoproteota archaeon]|nr:methyltransferase [Candidatus Brockarchaeota archaeon]